jgi:DegV family protein with EDD domain
VQVFDSLSASLGEGLQALAAAQAARAGASIQEILTKLEALRSRTSLVAVLDTLKYIKRGGRVDGFIAAAERMATALDIKLIINLVDGQLRPSGVARSLKSGLRRVLSLVGQMGPMEQLAVIHSRSQEKAAEMAERLPESAGLPKERILVQEIGGALACHAGPGLLGVVAVPSSPNR